MTKNIAKNEVLREKAHTLPGEDTTFDALRASLLNPEQTVQKLLAFLTTKSEKISDMTIPTDDQERDTYDVAQRSVDRRLALIKTMA